MLSVILPVKNEPNLGPFLGAVHEVLADIPDSYEVIIVQGDRETKNYPYPQFPHQRTVWTYGDSLERSILNGFSHAKGKQIIVMDSDGQHTPRTIPEIYKKLINGADIVVASRFAKGGSPGRMSPYRQLVTKTFIKTAYIMGVKSTNDPMSGFFGINKNIVEGLKLKPFKWKILYELLYKNRNKKIKIVEIPYTFQRREEGISTTSSKVGLKILWDILSASNKLQIYTRFILTAVIFSALIYMMNPFSLVNVISSIKIQYLSLAITSYFLMTSIMAYRLYHILEKMGEKVKFFDIFMAHSFGMLSSDIGFGKIGYLSTVPVMANNSNVKSDRGLSTILGIQSLELIVKGGAAVASFALITFFSNISLIFLTPVLISAGSIVILGILGIIFLFYKPFWLEDVPVFGDVAGYFNKYPLFKSSFSFIVGVSLVCWFIHGVEWYFLGQTLSLLLPFTVFLALHPILTLSKFIPLTPGSFGVFDLTVIWGLGLFGIKPELAFVFALLDRFDNIVDLVSLKELVSWRTGED